LRSKIFQTAVALKKHLSRRRFLMVGGMGALGTASSVQASTNPHMRFIAQRMAELAKPSIAPRFKPTSNAWDDHSITAAWLGHATVLINFQGLNIITDPVFFSRVGAQSVVGTVGPMRRQACALKPSELPRIDLVLLSHAHMDHLDFPSLRALGGNPVAVTAKNTGDLLKDTGISQFRELAWGERQTIETARGEVEVEAFEVRHWGARWRHDTQRGYNGYIVKRGGRKIIFGGDTAFCDGFKEIRGKGPFEFACMPIGAYNPFINSHCNPEQALQMTNDAGADYILPMHHFTFRFGRELSHEPLERLETALQDEPERLGWREAGETFVLKA
jgi:L-ascorbate metabolism protein UlaG (beta-lactamase superfamily)